MKKVILTALILFPMLFGQTADAVGPKLRVNVWVDYMKIPQYEDGDMVHVVQLNSDEKAEDGRTLWKIDNSELYIKRAKKYILDHKKECLVVSSKNTIVVLANRCIKKETVQQLINENNKVKK